MTDLLLSSPLLTIMVVVALGAAVGMIRFGSIRLGAAGALFVGLAIGAIDPALGHGLELIQALGLALFVYCVGLSSGATFFQNFRNKVPVLLAGLVIAGAGAALSGLLAGLFGLSPGLATGVYAGSLTSTPALSAATAATGSSDAAVGYALGYPVGVVVSLIAVALVVGRNWRGRKDLPSLAGAGLTAESVRVTRAASVRAVPGWADESIKMSYLIRDGHTRVIAPGEHVQPGDQVLVVGTPDAVNTAMGFLGERADERLTTDRTEVDFRRFLVSDPEVAGRSVAELSLPARFGGVITRVRRGDADLLARDDLVLQLGDRVLAVVPRAEMNAVSDFLGDSERKVSEVDAFVLGLGLAAGIALGLLTIPLPGGWVFTLGTAAGPLVVGMVLGALQRTGSVIWQIPLSANLTLRQLGLLLFLATVGLSSGTAFTGQVLTWTGLKAVVTATIVVAFSAVFLMVVGRLLGLSAPRTSGIFAGYIGQPAILSFAMERVDDERVDAGYASLFAVGIIAKIIAVQIVAALL